MAGHWSSEHVVAEYRDLNANAMAVDCLGQLALLAGRRALAVVGLNNPTESVKKIPRQSKYEISAANWNPHKSHSEIFVTACNQRAEIWKWTDSTGVQQSLLRGHTRVIGDLDWSPEDPNMLATCSVDTFTYLWDIRECRKPATSLQAVAGASQVKWNKVNSNLLATTHDGDIRIWDPRKGTAPVQYIAGHLSKIHGLDWNPASENHLSTSSQDCTVKFWDVTNPRQPEAKLPSGSPVWRARYTPFGKGLVTVVVPQLRRGENSLFLWYLDDLRQHVHTFVGHTDVVLEFRWRHRDEDSGDFQLVTWSKDQSLRLWRIDQHLQKLCGQVLEEEREVSPMVGDSTLTSGHLSEDQQSAFSITVPALGSKPDKELNKSLSLSTSTKSSGKKMEISPHPPHYPKTLQHEFTLLNICIPNVTVEEMDAINRTFTVSAVSGKFIVNLTMVFPEAYPNNATPSFQFGQSTTIDTSAQTKLTKVLRDTSLQHVRHNRSCIEPCLRQLMTHLEAHMVEEGKTLDSDYPFSQQQPTPSMQPPAFLPIFPYTMHDVSVPYPRASGAKFSGAGFLVCFTKTFVDFGRRGSSANDLTPRAMSELTYSPLAQSSRTPHTGIPLCNIFGIARSPPQLFHPREFYHKSNRSRSKSRCKDGVDIRGRESNSVSKKQNKLAPVVIYNTSCLLPIHRQLAENYVLDANDVPAMCLKNAGAAAAVGRKDLVQVWSLAALASSEMLKPDSDADKGPPWACHPFGRKLLESLISHYSCLLDVQTLAMLCCAFGKKYVTEKPTASDSFPKSSSQDQVKHNNDPFFLPPPIDGLNNWTMPVSKIRRSNSWSERLDDYRFIEMADPAETEREEHEKNSRLLDISKEPQYDQFKKAYADILYQWGLLNKRAEILKYVSTVPEPAKEIEFTAACHSCNQRIKKGPRCPHCKNYALQCVICHITVKGSSSFCLACGHGGHTMHMVDWFRTHNVCPTGCGCSCLQVHPASSIAEDD